MKYLALLLLLLSFRSHADNCSARLPNGDMPICSRTFQFYAMCNGGEMVDKWQIAGAPVGTSKIYPWLPYDVYIVGTDITVLYADKHYWYMLGDNMQGDPMLFVSASQDHQTLMYPPGTSWYMAAATPNDVANLRYIDLHGGCTVGQGNILVTLWYKPAQ